MIGIVLLHNLTTPEEGSDWVTFTRKNLHSLGIDTTNQIPPAQVDTPVNLMHALNNIFPLFVWVATKNTQTRLIKEKYALAILAWSGFSSSEQKFNC